MIPVSYNFRSLLVRRTTTLATAVGISLVVFVFATALSLAAGINKTFASIGQEGDVTVLRAGADSELVSTIEAEHVSAIASAAGVRRAGDGAPMAAGELVVVITASRRGQQDQAANVQVRGVPDGVLGVRTNVKVVSGRVPAPGTNEVMVGKGLASASLEGMVLGGTFDLNHNHVVSVVGVFEAAGSSLESELWADINLVRRAFGRDGLVSSVTLKLDQNVAFDELKAYLEEGLSLGIDVFRQSEYYRKQSEGTSSLIAALGISFAVLASLGAIIGAAITMYGSVDQRRREIGTLIALGFTRSAILISFILEALLVALSGAVAAVIATLLVSLSDISLVNLATFQEVVFRFDPTLGILIASAVFGCAIGVVGGFSPAMRAARMSPIEAMRT